MPEKTTQVACFQCSKKISSKSAIGVEHYKKFHPTNPELCYRQFATTWDDTMTRLIAGANSCQMNQELTLAKLDQTIKQLENENKMRNTLATKLNGIILILKSEA